MIKKLVPFLALAGLALILIAPIAHAQAPGQTLGPNGEPGVVDTEADVYKVISNLTKVLFNIFLALAVIMIIFAAYTYLTAGGGEGVEKAHKMLLYAAVAIAVALLSRGFEPLIRSLLKV